MMRSELEQMHKGMAPVWEAVMQAMQRPDQKRVRRVHAALRDALYPYQESHTQKMLDVDMPDGRCVFAHMIDAKPEAPRRLVI